MTTDREKESIVALGGSMGSFEEWLIAEQRREKEAKDARRRKLRLSRTAKLRGINLNLTGGE